MRACFAYIVWKNACGLKLGMCVGYSCALNGVTYPFSHISACLDYNEMLSIHVYAGMSLAEVQSMSNEGCC